MKYLILCFAVGIIVAALTPGKGQGGEIIEDSRFVPIYEIAQRNRQSDAVGGMGQEENEEI